MVGLNDKIKYDSMSESSIDLYIKYEGNNIYDSSEISTNIELVDIPIVVEAKIDKENNNNGDDFYYNDTLIITAKAFASDGEGKIVPEIPITYGDISFYFDGKKIDTIGLNSNGIAQISHIPHLEGKKDTEIVYKIEYSSVKNYYKPLNNPITTPKYSLKLIPTSTISKTPVISTRRRKSVVLQTQTKHHLTGNPIKYGAVTFYIKMTNPPQFDDEKFYDEISFREQTFETNIIAEYYFENDIKLVIHRKEGDSENSFLYLKLDENGEYYEISDEIIDENNHYYDMYYGGEYRVIGDPVPLSKNGIATLTYSPMQYNKNENIFDILKIKNKNNINEEYNLRSIQETIRAVYNWNYLKQGQLFSYYKQSSSPIAIKLINPRNDIVDLNIIKDNEDVTNSTIELKYNPEHTLLSQNINPMDQVDFGDFNLDIYYRILNEEKGISDFNFDDSSFLTTMHFSEDENEPIKHIINIQGTPNDDEKIIQFVYKVPTSETYSQGTINFINFNIEELQ